MKRYTVSLVALLLLCTAACQYKDVVKADKDFALSMHAVQTTILAAYDSNPQFIDKDTKDKAFAVCLKVDLLGKQIHEIIVSVNKIDPASKQKIVALLSEISKSLDPKSLMFIAGIKNTKTQLEVEAGFTAARSVITAMQLALN